ncbi:hypothetical protein P4475_12730 [Halalkalibacterium halodurans]|jgi:hypothetical protein|uniref:Extracellular solute-binding protein n=1 Tax=Halalkalibacterium halodurans TaxID=86665 RepID=A0A0M0KDS6_ALKHA|nr:hypothetical protein [Halalkalibacterium halodurans]MED3647648.1 hypothetical protein [Halalkalibacterium halodurans]MED4164472.1 hypothetical protein [Halalkalibacterium halodurans]TES47146.1 hypothetical protein E2L07_19350 [Halalkalibacterium halodurans]TPE69797.1 hypothetical protein AMD02_006485 [Halalkalibacterium halodurans]
MKWFILLLSLYVISGCSNSSDQLEVKIYSESLQPFVHEIERAVSDVRAVDIQFQAPFAEKLVLDIVAQEGDLFIVDEDLLRAIYDPIGLYPLYEVSRESFVDQERLSDYEDREGGEVTYYALPLSFAGSDVALFIPLYSERKEEVMDLLIDGFDLQLER